jgi:hypothetical protein
MSSFALLVAETTSYNIGLTRRFNNDSGSWIGGSQSSSLDRSERCFWSQVILVFDELEVGEHANNTDHPRLEVLLLRQ